MRTSTRLAAVGVLAVALLGAGCKKDDNNNAATTTTQAPAGITITDAWCRTSPAMADAGACYAKITNGGNEADSLTKASVPSTVAGKTELHETVQASSGTGTTMMGTGTTMMGSGTTMAGGHNTGTTMAGGGMMQMQPVSEIAIPGGKTVMLEPGGYHIMLLELAEPLKEGSSVEVTLTFAKAGEKQVKAEVRAS